MATLVHTYPQQTSTVTMLQTRPASAAGLVSHNQNQQGQSYAGQGHVSRGSYGGTPTGYRGSSGSGQPRSFSGQNLNHNMQWQHYAASRTNSSPAVPSMGSYDPNAMYRTPQYANGYTGQNVGYSPAYGMANGIATGGARDDSALASRNFAPVQQSGYYGAGAGPTRNAPDRYRRANAQAVHHNRSQSSISSGYMANANGGLYKLQSGSLSVPNLSGSKVAGSSAANDDMLANRPGSSSRSSERRGSFTTHSRNGSAESVSSSRSTQSRPSSAHKQRGSISEETSVRGDQSKSLNVPTRGSSSDAIKRTISPSPLSRQAALAGDAAEDATPSRMNKIPGSSSANLETPAAKQLAAIGQKGGKGKSKTSRLRRAFSFGSATDFLRAAEADNAFAAAEAAKPEPAKLHKEPSEEEAYDAEQARIAQAQEAGGIGNSIYGSRFFGSTDNLSISSTASSASIMIRKMGRGMKKSTRSLVGLFRPKSVIGVPAAEPLEPETSQATASMITAEAESQRVNVNADPVAANGGTGFPHLERNSLDAAQLPQLPEIGSDFMGTTSLERPTSARRNITGGERDRAEVLAAVRKGILKRPGSASPSLRPLDISPELVLPGIPMVSDSPNSSAPSTPVDESQGNRRTESISLATEDYFSTGLRLRRDSKSPGTPQGSTNAKRNATFSPRIVFYDTWTSQDYDRRGEVATCNRLTPLLAQQIKEELNSFKMEMEVHENSKIYTHFF